MYVDMHIFYMDLHTRPSIEQKPLKKYRDDQLFHLIHRHHKVPLFPMRLRKFVAYKSILEIISVAIPYACFCFDIDNEFHVLHEGMYSVYRSPEDAYKVFQANL